MGGADALRVLDLFSGGGGLSLGVAEAARALERGFESVAVDNDEVALAIYAANFPNALELQEDISSLIDGVGDPPTLNERRLLRASGTVDFLVGLPCQGHSAANNRTRHRDARNALYLTMVRAAELFEPSVVLIENVPGARNDRSQIVEQSVAALSDRGFHVATAVVDMSQIGGPAAS